MGLIRKLVAERKAEVKWIEGYFPDYYRRLQRIERGKGIMRLDEFIDIMTGLRCEVIVVPRDGRANRWYLLNDFPDAEGNVLKMPEHIKRGRAKRKK